MIDWRSVRLVHVREEAEHSAADAREHDHRCGMRERRRRDAEQEHGARDPREGDEAARAEARDDTFVDERTEHEA